MRFDLASFLIGFAIAAVIGLVLYRFRANLAKLRQSAQTRSGSTRQFLTSSADKRYLEELTKYANRYHLAGEEVTLSEIYVEPRFIPAIQPVDLDETNRVGSIFHVIPMVHDLPAIYSPFNINTLSINDLRAGEKHLVLLGLPGSGKSTALAILALYANSQIDLRSLDSLAEQVMRDEDKELSDAERDERARIRKEQEERALAQLRATQRYEAESADRLKQEQREVVDFKQLMPILIHVRDLDFSVEGEKTTTQDPAEPVVRAIMRRFGVVAANAIPGLVYNRLANGQCLVLIDGFDELGPSHWPEKLTWLEQFMSVYGENFIIVTGPVKGYDALVNAGFTPLYVRPWSDADFNVLIGRWSEAWPLIGGTRRKPAPVPDERLIKRVLTNNRGRTALDVTLKTWAAFAGDEQATGRKGAYDYYVRAQLGDEEKQRLAVDALAGEVLNQGMGPLTKDRAKEVITAALTSEGEKPPSNISELMDGLLAKRGLFSDGPGGRFMFRHPLLSGFLAAESIIKLPPQPEVLPDLAMNRAWEVAIPFLAASAPPETMTALVAPRLAAPPDLLFSSLIEMGTWLPDGPSDARWRKEIMQRLGSSLLAQLQFLTVRERALAALVTSRDSGIIFVLRQALKSPDANLRRLACIGLGALGDTEALKDLSEALGDKDADVQLAAGLGLGALNSETAIETMAAGLLDGEESLRRAVAETLAAIPDPGHQLLQEAIHSQDMFVRRAAVFGLSRVKAAWALALIYRTQIEDAQWYVQSAADQAFREAEKPQGEGLSRHPEPEALPWLLDWAANVKGESVPVGTGGRQVLVRALQEGDPLRRAAAALTLAYLGYVPSLKPLYTALRDPDETVRALAYEALGVLQVRLGKPLPGIV